MIATAMKTSKPGIFNYEFSGLDWKEGACQTGKRQTPIHIHETETTPAPDSEAYGVLGDLPDGTLEYEHNKLQVEYDRGVFNLKNHMGETKFKSLQFHFHGPADHHIDHYNYDIEFHVVFQNVEDPTRFLATGIFFHRDPLATERNEFLDSLNLDEVAEGFNKRDVKLSGLYDRFIGKRIYNYDGSLSVPPCTENVEWIVFSEPIRVPESQILPFLKMWSYNKEFAKGRGTNRVFQDRNNREVYTFDYGKTVKTQAEL